MRQEPLDQGGAEEIVMGDDGKTVGKILAGALIAGILYMGTCCISACRSETRIITRYEAIAIQKADKNKNGHLEIEEILGAYRELSLSGEQIYSKIERAAKHRLVEHSFAGLSREVHQKFFASFAEYADFNSDTYACKRRMQDLIEYLCKAATDSDNDGKISIPEAEEAFRKAYSVSGWRMALQAEMNSPTFGLSTYNKNDSLFESIFHPDRILNPDKTPPIYIGSELERYVNNKGPGLNHPNSFR